MVGNDEEGYGRGKIENPMAEECEAEDGEQF